MTKDEAMKQALEALDCIYSPLHVREIEKVGKAMSALRIAIEQMEKQEPVAWAEGDEDGNIVWSREDCFSDDPEWLDNPMPLYTTPPAAQPAPVQPDKHLQLALEALAPLEKLFMQADEQGLLTGANVDCQIATNDLRKSAYAASDIRAHMSATPPAAQRQWVGTVDCIGLALDLEVQAKRIESQTIERAMLAAANGLRIIDKESKA